MQSFFEKSCAQDAGDKIGGDAQGFESRAEGARRFAAVEAGDEADLRVGERRDYLLQVARFDADVAVIDEQDFVAGVGEHLRKIADFDICAECAIADDEFYCAVGKLLLQPGDHFASGVGWVADAEDQLEVGVVLLGVAEETLPHLGIGAFERLEDGDGRKRGGVRVLAIALQECDEPAEGENIERQRSDRAECGDNFQR